jgi:hypothetical protein
LSELVPGLIVAGVGLELVNPRLASAAAATVRPAIAAAASRTISTFRQIGTATGVAAFGAIFVTQLSDHISGRTAGFAQLANENPTIASLVLDGRTAQAVSSSPAAVRSQILAIIQSGFAGAIHDVFFVAALVALASAVLALLTRSSDVPRTGARQLRSQITDSQITDSQSTDSHGSGKGAAASRTAAPSPNGARPEPVVPATSVYATSAAATLAALGITVATPPSVPDELTSTNEVTTPGELPGLGGLAAPGPHAPLTNGAVSDAPLTNAPLTNAPLTNGAVPDALSPGALVTNGAAPDAPSTNGAALDIPAPDALGQDAQITEPDMAEAPAASTVRIPAVQAWPGWSGWQAPDEEPTNEVGPTVPSDMALASPQADETPASPPADKAVEGPTADDAVPGLPVEPQPGEEAPEDTLEVVAVADFVSYWHLAETPGPGTANGDVAETGPEEDVAAETGPEDAGGPVTVTMGRRWVRGQVTAGTGEPLAGALVTLVNTDGDEAGHAIAGSDGSFAVGDLLEGTYTLIAAAPHFRPSASIFALHSQEATVMLNLIGIGSLTGKITTAKDGRPMSVDIELVCPDEGVAAQYRTGKDGCFLLTDLPEGNHELVVRNAGYRTVEMPVVVDRGQTRTIGVAMVGLGHLYGAVTGPGGEWMPGAQIALSDGNGTVVASTRTDGAGSYRFSEVPEGPYTVRATAFGPAGPVVEVEAGSTVAADVNLASP